MKAHALAVAALLLCGSALAAGGPTCVIEDLTGDFDHCTSRICDDTNDFLEIICRIGPITLPAESATHIEDLTDSVGSQFDTIPLLNFGDTTQRFLVSEPGDDDCTPWWCQDLAQWDCGCTGTQCPYEMAPVEITMYGVGQCQWQCYGWDKPLETAYCIETSPIDDHPCNPEDDPSTPFADCDGP